MIDMSPLDRHSKIALAFSGGKDALACLYLLREHLDRMTVYHVDSGDLLPEVREIVDHVASFCPNFVRIQSDVNGWMVINGIPSDLVPHSAHFIGQMMGEGRTRLSSRYDCCYHNIMAPLLARIVSDGNTLVIRGSRASDMKKLPAKNGHVFPEYGLELWLPIEAWTDADVFAYLRSVGAPIHRGYDYMATSPDCARCSAWWTEKRGAYLKKFHPALWTDYTNRLHAITMEIRGPLDNLTRELGGVG